MRFGILMGLALYAAFGILDLALLDDVRALWVIRYGIISPMLAIMLFWSFRPSFQRIEQLVVAAGAAAAGVSVIAMTIITPSPANYLYHTGLLVVLMYTFSFLRLRFIYALAAAVFLVVAYNIATLIVGETPTPILFNNNFYLAVAIILGGFAAYSMERYARRNFVQKRTIAARSAELEKKNEELVAANRQLIESKQELVQSSKRAQLIFSALADALPGTVLDDKYEVGEKIGSGGFGTVYRGRHVLLDAPVAIKIFRPSSTKDLQKSLERFRLEGISAKRINHPNAIAVLDFGISGEAIAFLVMELLHGRNVAEELHDVRRMPVRRSAEIAVPVCSVLAEAHRNGIIHRDIKPSNVFLHNTTSGEVVKVVDFGIAKLLEPSADRDIDLTETGALIGTMSYMSPERLDGAPYGLSSDVYSVGVMLFEMLTGQKPFQSESEAFWRSALARMKAPPPSLREMQPEIPGVLDDIVRRALAPIPEDRPTATEMAETIAAEFELPLPIVYTSDELPPMRTPAANVVSQDEPTLADASEPTVPFERR